MDAEFNFLIQKISHLPPRADIAGRTGEKASTTDRVAKLVKQALMNFIFFLSLRKFYDQIAFDCWADLELAIERLSGN
eukprot:scaffold8957_cov85-Cylindrotheca_fusiformis.AAC.2